MSIDVTIKLFNGTGKIYLGTVKFIVSSKILLDCLLKIAAIIFRTLDTFLEFVVQFRLVFEFFFETQLKVLFNCLALDDVLVKAVFKFIKLLV